MTLHGDYSYDKLKNTTEELQQQESKLEEALIKEFTNRPVIVCGYSGRDISVMNAFKKAFGCEGAGALYWCVKDPNKVEDPVLSLVQLARKNGRPAYIVKAEEGFDEIMKRLGLFCLDDEGKKKVEQLIDQHDRREEKEISVLPTVVISPTAIRIGITQEDFRVTKETAFKEFADDASKAYLEACELQERARKSPAELELFKQAAEKLNSAREHLKLAASKASNEEERSRAEVFGAYYHYAEHDCLRSYYYEKHDVVNARIHHEEAKGYLAQAISLADKALAAVSKESASNLSKYKREWQHYEKINQQWGLVIDSREAWDKKEYLRALDVSRRILRSCEEVIADASDQALDPVYERVARGNQFVTLMNEYNSLVSILQIPGDGIEENPLDLVEYYVRLSYEAFKYGQEAFIANPESHRYREDSNRILGKIKEFLNLNRSLWGQLYDVFRDEPGVLKIMREVDVDRFRKVEDEKLFRTSKIVQLWGEGSFFLLVFIVVAGFVIFFATQAVSWWQLLLGITGIEVLIIILGAFIFRSTGKLSEKNFMSLILLAFQDQFKKFISLKELFKGKSEPTSNADGDKPST